MYHLYREILPIAKISPSLYFHAKISCHNVYLHNPLPPCVSLNKHTFRHGDSLEDSKSIPSDNCWVGEAVIRRDMGSQLDGFD